MTPNREKDIEGGSEGNEATTMQLVDPKLWASSAAQGFEGRVRWLLGELAWERIPHKVLMGAPDSEQVTVKASLC